MELSALSKTDGLSSPVSDTATGKPAGPGSVGWTGRTPDRHSPPPWSFLIAYLGAVAVVGFAVRGVFLFSDDYAFLGQAERMPFDLDYLAADLFGHFSPVSRVVNALSFGFLSAHPGALWWILLALTAATQASLFLLLRTIFGRNWPTLVGAVLLATSLTLVPLANWWTAAFNILPAMAGSALCLAGVVAYSQGRSRWWGALAIAGYLLAILDYELTMIIGGYAALWVVLFRSRMTTETLSALLRRTGWMWSILVVAGALALVNFVRNYYVPGLPAATSQKVIGLAVSLFDTLLPSLLGFHDPDTPWFAALGTVVGAVVLLWLLAFTLLNRREAWRGWVFAAAGWLGPSGSLVAARVGLHGTWVATLPFYFFLPTMLVVMGVLAAVTSPPRRPARAVVETSPTGGGPRRARVAATALGAVVVIAWLSSVGPSAASIQNFGAKITHVTPPDADYVQNMRASADQLNTGDEQISVLNTDVPAGLVPPMYGPYNRADWVAELNGISLQFDRVGSPTYLLDQDGSLQPARIDWTHELAISTGAEPGLTITGADNLRTDPVQGVCFDATTTTKVTWQLPELVTAERIVVRSEVSVSGVTIERLVVQPGVDSPFELANYDDQSWSPDQAGRLDTVMSPTVSALSFDSLTPGTGVCLAGLAIGVVQQAR